MLVQALLALAVALFGIFILGAIELVDRRSLARLVKSRYIVTLTSGEAFEGVLLANNRKNFVLAHAIQHGRGNPTPVDGSLYLLREQVMYLQKVGAA